MSELQFFKMEGAGNDFIVIDNREYEFSLEEIIEFTPDLCDRKFGIGADGLLVLQPCEDKDIDYTMIYRNADGSDAGMCGNGSRCLALYASFNGFDTSQKFKVHDKVYEAVVNKSEYEVSVTFPDVAAPKTLNINKKRYLQVYPGTEHLVSIEHLERLDEEEELVTEGRTIRNHPILNPPGTNVNFVSDGEEDDLIYLQTYERGVEDLTYACGTGALASAIAFHHLEPIIRDNAMFTVQVKGGILGVSFQFSQETNTYKNLKLSGPAHFVFEGTIEI